MFTEYPRPNEERAQLAIVFLYLAIAVQAILFLLNFVFLARIQLPVQLPTAPIRAFLGIGNLVTWILSAVFFIRWFRRAYYNLHLVGSRYVSFSEGWASGAWFVPFVNLGRPYRIMKEIWVETQLTGQAHGVQEVEPTIVGWWWAAWLTANFSSNIGTQIQINVRSYQGYEAGILFLTAGNLVMVVAGLASVHIIRRISGWEKEMKERYISYLTMRTQEEYRAAQQAGTIR